MAESTLGLLLRTHIGGLESNLIGQANADAEAELQIRLHQTGSRLLRAIEEALGRIRQGTFGVCQVCKQPISSARQEAELRARQRLPCSSHQIVWTTLERRISRSAVIRESPSTSAVAPIMRSAGSLG